MVAVGHPGIPQPACLPGLTLKQLLNRGKFGQVYIASDDAKQRLVAVKVVKCTTPQAENSLAREIDISLHAKHPAIIETYTLNRDDDGVVYIVQELACGGDLYDYLMDSGACTAKEEASLKEVFRQVASALDYLHHELHVVHRDVKLENICMVPSSSKGEAGTSVRLIDFGLADHMEHDGTLRVVPGAVGTSMYIAPEALALRRTGGRLEHPEKLDSFAAGVLLYALVSGNFPWDEASDADPDFADFARRLDAGEDGAAFGVDPTNLGYTSHMAELINGLLDPDPGRRLTVRDAVELFISKPWFLPEGMQSATTATTHMSSAALPPSVLSGATAITT